MEESDWRSEVSELDIGLIKCVKVKWLGSTKKHGWCDYKTSSYNTRQRTHQWCVITYWCYRRKKGEEVW